MSQTGASADEWIPSPGGTEGIFALSLANVMIQRKTAARRGRQERAGDAIAGMVTGIGGLRTRKDGKTDWGASRHHCPNCSRGCRECAGSRVDRRCGCGTVEWSLQRAGRECVERAARQRGKTGRNPFQLSEKLRGRASSATGASGIAPEDSLLSLVNRIRSAPDALKVLLVYDANPVFATPAAWRVRDAFEKIPFIASFGSFIDETSALADLILPDHSPLESWLDDAPPSGSARTVVSVRRTGDESAPRHARDAGRPSGRRAPARRRCRQSPALEDLRGSRRRRRSRRSTKRRAQKARRMRTSFGRRLTSKADGGARKKAATPIGAGEGWRRSRENHARLQFDGDAERVSIPLSAVRFAAVSTTARSRTCRGCRKRPIRSRPSCGGRGSRSIRRRRRNWAIKQGDLLEVASQHGKLARARAGYAGHCAGCDRHASRAGSRKFHALRNGTRRESDFDSRADARWRRQVRLRGPPRA